MTLGFKLILRFALGIFFVLVLFLVAGTFRYWDGWACLCVWFIPGTIFFAYFYRRDPAMLQRRMQHKERVKE